MLKIGVVLLSGGLDSTVAAVYAQKLGFQIHAFTVNYGQRLQKEVKCAQQVAETLNVSHKVVDIVAFKEIAWYSALTRTNDFMVPKENKTEIMNKSIPITYVPMRNTFFIILAAAYLESEVLKKIETEKIRPEEIMARIFIAANVMDYSGYPDCRPEFYERINGLMKVASKIGTQYDIEMKIETPLLYKNKKEIVELGINLKAPLEQSWSCYEGGEIPCGKCDSCLLRMKGFSEAEVEDPLLLRLNREGKI